MPKRTASYEDDLMERLRDPEYALDYLQVALEDDGDDCAGVTFLLALRKVAQASQMTQVAEAAGLSRESLYKMLSENGNPAFRSLRSVLKSVGLDLAIKTSPHQDVIAADTFTQEAEPPDEWSAVAVVERADYFLPRARPTYCLITESSHDAELAYAA